LIEDWILVLVLSKQGSWQLNLLAVVAFSILIGWFWVAALDLLVDVGLDQWIGEGRRVVGVFTHQVWTESCLVVPKLGGWQVLSEITNVYQILRVVVEQRRVILVLSLHWECFFILEFQLLFIWEIEVWGRQSWVLDPSLLAHDNHVLVWSKTDLFCDHSSRIWIVILNNLLSHLAFGLFLQAVLVNLEIRVNDASLGASGSVPFSRVRTESGIIFRYVFIMITVIFKIIWAAKAPFLLGTYQMWCRN
jgi:hypothetical protein